MATAAEAAGKQGQMRATLEAGVEQLSIEQTVTFYLYQKYVFAVDGFVFWIKTPQPLTVKGSLHIATDRIQDEDQTIGANQIILTSEQLITEFNTLEPNTMWIGDWPIGVTQTLQIAFAHRASFYKQADLFHYSGYAVYPALQSQLVQSIDDLPQGPITSNSLAIWIAQNTWQNGMTLLTVPVVPSWAVPENIIPPYVVAHIEPSSTVSFGNMPAYQYPGTLIPDSGISPLYEVADSQLSRDDVKLILYGFNNQMARAYLNSLISYSLVGPGETPTFGFANSPVPQDEKRTQTEIAALAMKKSLFIQANYYQSTADAIAYRLILKALDPTITLVPV